MHSFEAYGTSHFVMLAIFIAGIFPLVIFGVRIRGGHREQTFRRAYAAILFLAVAPWEIWTLLPENWKIATSLPFELCDLAWLSAVVAMWTRRQWFYGPLYYWGLTLTSQALFTPRLTEDFPNLTFFMFWTEHIGIVWAAIFMTWGLGFRPAWRSLGRTLGITVGWGTLMFAFNTAANTNYMFVNRKPATASALDLLGPWPIYLFEGLAIVVAIWALMTWPWIIVRKAHSASRQS